MAGRHIEALVRLMEITHIYYSTSSFIKYKNLVVTAVSFVLYIVSATAAYNAGFKKSIQQSAYFLVIGLLTHIQQVYLIFSRDKVKNLIDTLTGYNQRHTEKWQMEMEGNIFTMWKRVTLYRASCFVYLCVMVTPWIVDTVGGWMFPYMPSVRVPIICQGLVDMTEPRSLENMMYSALGVFWTVCTTEAHVGTQILILASVLFTRTELEMISQKLSLLEEVLERKGKKNSKIVKKLLVDIIQHHQNYLQGHKVLNETIGFLIAVQISFASICICVNLYCIAIFDFTKKDLGMVIVNVVTLCIIASLQFFMSYIGESLETAQLRKIQENARNLKNDEIYRKLFHIPWYKEDTYFAKHLNMLIVSFRVPCVISYFEVFKLNLNSFIKTMNASYSYFMILKSTGEQLHEK